MKVGKQELAGVGIYALAGSVMAGLYKLSMLYIETKGLLRMETPVEGVLHDTLILPLLYRLEKRFKEYDPVLFCRLVEHIDQVVLSRLSLHQTSGEDELPPISQNELYFHFSTARDDARQLRSVVDRVSDISDLVAYDRLVVRLFEHLEEHMVQLMKVAI